MCHIGFKMKKETPHCYYDIQVQAGDILICKRCWHQWIVDKNGWIKRRCPNCRKRSYNDYEHKIFNFSFWFKSYVSAMSYHFRKKNNIKPSSCIVCGFLKTNMAGHHENYLKPFDIIWMCFSCHVKYHKDIKNSIQKGEENGTN